MSGTREEVWLERLASGDPFDALRGSRIPRWLRASARGRQAVIQLRKRSPLDLASILGVDPFVMSKAVGCFLVAEGRRAALRADSDDAVVLERLLASSQGHVGDGQWGYEFDVQTRWAFYPAGTANLIATAFVARGYAEAGVGFARGEWIKECALASSFVSDCLVAEDGVGPFIRYVPDSDAVIHNANVLGAGLLAVAGALVGDDALVDKALACALRTVDAQRPDGSWQYGEGAGLEWEDNFHTAYVLDGLSYLVLATGHERVREALERGVVHWTSSFFGTSGEPFYGPVRHYPYDIHSAATAVDTAARLATWGHDTDRLAERVSAWATRELVDESTGRTGYQRRRCMSDKRHFVRWGDAHWAMAASSLALMRAGARSPLESAVALREQARYR